MDAETHGRRLISVIIPVLNEENGIADLGTNLRQLREALHELAELEFIFVDDGSTDRTSGLLRAAFGSEDSCQILTHAENRGVGAAFRTGFEHARGSVICTIDADCSYRPEGLRHLVDLLDATGADIAVASPYHPQGRVENIVPWRIFVSRVCSAIYRLISPVQLYTYTSIFRVYRRQVIQTTQFESDGFVSAAEIVIRAAGQGYQIVELPMTLRGRRAGTSKMRVLRTIRTHLRMMRRILLQALESRWSRMTGKRRAVYGSARGPVVSQMESAAGTEIPGLSAKE